MATDTSLRMPRLLVAARNAGAKRPRRLPKTNIFQVETDGTPANHELVAQSLIRQFGGDAVSDAGPAYMILVDLDKSDSPVK